MHLVLRLRGGGGFAFNATDYITGAVVELDLGESGKYTMLDAAAKKIAENINLKIKPE